MIKLPSPFRYPQSKHRRKYNPQYRTNKSYKKVLRYEFNRQCIYCRRPEFYKHEDFGVEHYKPKEIFPELEWDYDNLFYACNTCNSRKGESWPTKTQIANNAFIPNPCEHIMFKHLKFHGATVELRSEAGIYTDELLDLNDDVAVSFREAIIYLIRKLIVDISLTKKRILKLENKLRDKSIGNIGIEIKEEIANQNNNISKLKKTLIECGVSL